MKAMTTILLACAALVAAVASPRAHAGPDFPMVLVVTDTSGQATADSPLYFASSLNNWEPGDPEWRLKKVGADGEAGIWELPLKPEQLAGREVEFKITRGSWDTVEVGPEGHDINNRTVGSSGWAMDGARLALKIEVPGYADQRATRWPALATNAGVDRTPSVTGDLEVFQVRSAYLANSRAIRVWLPPGYGDEANAERRYPVLYLNDGQNLFDRATSFGGHEWQADETATRLINEGKIQPLIIVGIDNNGITRSQEYNAPGISWGGREGHGDKYMQFVTEELMPYINSRFRTLKGPENTGFGGSSFGGNITLYAAMNNADTFGRLLIESPAVAVQDRAMIKLMQAHTRAWPQRLFIAVGTSETSRPADAAEYQAAVEEVVEFFRARRFGEDRLKFVVAKDAVHNEQAWAKRLPEALVYLFGK